MKNIFFALTAMALMTLSSCYIGVRGGHPHHRRPAKVIIHAEQKDSLPSPAMSSVNQNDSLKVPVSPATVK
jgi:hypothetical protein